MEEQDVGAEVLAVSAAWDAALIADDPAAFAGFVVDDWVYIGPTGVDTRAEIIGWIASGTLSHHTMRTIGRPRVAVHRDTAVFVRQSGRWRCVLSHKCPVGPA